MHWVYILESLEDRSWYIGYTTNLRRRLMEHQTGKGANTTRREQKHWKLIYCEGYVAREDAQGRERFLKSGAGRKFLKKQLAHYIG